MTTVRANLRSKNVLRNLGEIMQNRIVVLMGLLALSVAALAVVVFPSNRPVTAADEQQPAVTRRTRAAAVIGHRDGTLRFPDFGYMIPPKEYQGRVFRLSQDYPREKPPVDAAVKKILEIDFQKDWKPYLEAVREYVFEGNVKPTVEGSFFLEDNNIRNWYHVPWQHWGPTGREGFHGLTQEGPIEKQMLAQTQSSTSHAYAVGFYNAQGGYTIGRMWPSTSTPDFTDFATDNGFPVGTVVAKLLFTTLDSTQVPYLVNPVSWDAYVYKSDVPSIDCPSEGSARIKSKVNLIQMDIMVRDPRANATGGWVFGNFVYNGEQGSTDGWHNLMPVGIMWGNDPDQKESYTNQTPTQTMRNPKLTQTIINPDPKLPPMHLGWSGRLNGPVDNPASSCMSCHSTAEYPTRSPIMPFLNNPKIPIPPNGTEASADWMRWFRNVPCGTSFDPDTITQDYSLQLTKSAQNYVEWRDKDQGGILAVEYGGGAYKVRRNASGN